MGRRLADEKKSSAFGSGGWENTVFTHNGVLSVMHFTRVLPYKIAHLQHVVARSFVIPMFVAVLFHF